MASALRVFSLMAGLASVAVWGLSRTQSRVVSRQSRVHVPDKKTASRPLTSFPRCSSVSALTRDEAEALLLWLRSAGKTHTEIIYVPDEGFTVFFY